VMVEKPMAMSLVDARAMVDAARSAGVTLVVAENQVYESDTLRVRAEVERGTSIGNIVFAQIVAGYRAPNPVYPGRRSWLTSPEQGGTGTWWLQGVHTVSRARSILGDIVSVYATETRTSTFERDDLEGTIHCSLVTTEGGSVSLLQTPEVELGGSNLRMSIYGDRGRLELSDERLTVWRGKDRLWDEEITSLPQSSYAAQYAAFAAEIQGASEAPTSGSRELNTIAVVESALASIAQRQVISLA
jgi:predicted dehydrogenase